MAVWNCSLCNLSFSDKSFLHNELCSFCRTSVYEVNRALKIVQKHLKVIAFFLDEGFAGNQHSHWKFLSCSIFPKSIHVKYFSNPFLTCSQSCRNKWLRNHGNSSFLAEELCVHLCMISKPFHLHVFIKLKSCSLNNLLQHIFRCAALTAGNNSPSLKLGCICNINIVSKDMEHTESYRTHCHHLSLCFIVEHSSHI